MIPSVKTELDPLVCWRSNYGLYQESFFASWKTKQMSPWKTNMTMENQPFEDVSPLKNGDFPLSHLSFGGECMSMEIHHVADWRKCLNPPSTEVPPVQPLALQSDAGIWWGLKLNKLFDFGATWNPGKGSQATLNRNIYIYTRFFRVTFSEGCKWLFQGLSDLHLGCLLCALWCTHLGSFDGLATLFNGRSSRPSWITQGMMVC